MISLLPVLLAASLVSETRTSTKSSDEPPFTDAQLDWLERLRDELRESMPHGGSAAAGAGEQAKAPSVLELKAEAYMKWLFRNNASQGCVTYGNPHPRGDNYTGDNGQCPEFALTLIGRPTSKIEAGFRLQSRFGQDFADWFENGDKRLPADASGESLGMNHAAAIQVRQIFVRLSEPLPLIDWFLAGSSDLSYFDPWTVGKVRFIDRFNAKGLFLKTSVYDFADVLVSRIAMSKLFGTANYNSLEDALITNPFWARDAIYATAISTKPTFMSGIKLSLNGAVSLDEEADTRDPDAAGSINTVDARNDVTAVDTRFLGANASLTIDVSRFEFMRVRGLVALSHNKVNPSYVTNLALGGLGFSNIVFRDANDVAGTLRVDLPDLIGRGRALHFEYFNIGADFNAVAGARREADVLLTDGFLDGGQLPTLNVANELMDFNDKFYESAIGWHGATLVLDQEADRLDFAAEATVIEYNTDLQDRDMNVYPGFGGFTGYTDTDLFSYANTNDRGRDPRSVYARDQARRTFIFMGKLAFKPTWWSGARLETKLKAIRDTDQRDQSTKADDYAGTILTGNFSVGAQPWDTLSGAIGVKLDYWVEDGRSGTYAGGVPDFIDYKTKRLKPYIDLRYSLGAVSAGYHLEMVKKDVDTTDPSRNFTTGLIWRSVGFLSAQM